MAAKKEDTNVVVIDGKDLILGRLGSKVAKMLLAGMIVKIVNCREVVILGRKKFLVERYKNKIANKVVGQGPYYSRSPADLVRRAMRNMLPYKNERGVQAYKRLKCFNSVPSILLSSEKIKVDTAQLNLDSVFYYTKMADLCKSLGYNRL